MADIAILVAEEYERRIKNSRKLASAGGGGGGGGEGEVIDLLSGFSVLQGQKLEASSSPLVKMKLIGGQEKRLEMMKNKVLEPHFEVGVAARNGFFSA